MHWITLLSWLAYGLLHSLLASTRFNALLTAFLPGQKRYFRLVYNLLAIGLLVALGAFTLRQPSIFFFQPNWYTALLAFGCLAAGGAIGIAAFRHYSGAEFIGITHLKNREEPKPETLVTSGLNARVRHPLYSATVLLLTGICLLWPCENIVSAAAGLLLYLPMGIYWEELKLLKMYGDAYAQYQQQVKRLIPGIW